MHVMQNLPHTRVTDLYSRKHRPALAVSYQ